MTSTSVDSKQPSSPKGRRRREIILDAAEKILIDEGYAEFSVRKLADNLAISLSNVQYYFPTPNEVIDALFARALEKASQEMESGVADDLLSLTSYSLRHQKNARNCHLCWEMWALSARNTDVARTFERFYTAYRNSVEKRIATLEPKLTASARRRRAILIMSLLSGLSLFRGHDRKLAGTGPALDRDIREAVLLLARTDLKS